MIRELWCLHTEKLPCVIQNFKCTFKSDRRLPTNAVKVMSGLDSSDLCSLKKQPHKVAWIAPYPSRGASSGHSPVQPLLSQRAFLRIVLVWVYLVAYYENKGSQKAGKRSGTDRSAFRRKPELTQELGHDFQNCQWAFRSCDDFDGLLLLLSLTAPSRGNKNKFCLVQNSSWHYLKVGCNLRKH